MTKPASSPPKLFISYSWSSPEHEDWVIQLATGLRQSGIDAILDKWHLREGQEATAFMEQMVNDPQIRKVVMVCDRVYQEKTNKRAGGVGTEAQIISSEIYKQQDQSKFVAVVAEVDDNGKPYVPVYYTSRLYIDLSKVEIFSDNFDRLVRWAFDQPLYEAPAIGRPPSFIMEPGLPGIATSTPARRAIEAFRAARPSAPGLLDDYLTALSEGLPSFRVRGATNDLIDQEVLGAIDASLAYRDEFLDVASAVARYADAAEHRMRFHRFFEKSHDRGALLAADPPKHDSEFDALEFLIHELFLCLVAVLVAEEHFSAASYLFDQRYFIEGSPGRRSGEMKSYTEFQAGLGSLERESKRRSRVSKHGDLLVERATHPTVTRLDLLQADFIVYVRACFEAQRSQTYARWWPVSLLHSAEIHGAFKFFARCESQQFFERMKSLFGITGIDHVKGLQASFRSGQLKAPQWNYYTPEIFELLNIDKLCSRP